MTAKKTAAKPPAPAKSTEAPAAPELDANPVALDELGKRMDAPTR